ncbi:hypothetical protein ACVWZ6_003010 [Bradyrhizobium sp. GM6.1]
MPAFSRQRVRAPLNRDAPRDRADARPTRPPIASRRPASAPAFVSSCAAIARRLRSGSEMAMPPNECHQSILRLSSLRALDKFRLREGFPHSDAWSSSQALSSSRFLKRSLGVKKRSRTARPGSRPGPSPSPTPACRPPARQDRNPDQRQPFRRRLRRIGRQKPLKLIAPCTQPRQRLMLAHVAELRLPRTQGPCGPPPERPSIPGRSA